VVFIAAEIGIYAAGAKGRQQSNIQVRCDLPLSVLIYDRAEKEMPKIHGCFARIELFLR
jgi:hypothetical protein